MAFVVNFYNFAKRENSTARPTGGTSFNCILKSESSIINPTIELQLAIDTAPSYNYAYIPSYNRYYFVKEWTFNNRLWSASLSVDVLATYKTEIGNSFLYITRSSATFDGSIVDTAYPVKTKYTKTINEVKSPFKVVLSAGTYILGVTSGSSTSGAVAYYALTADQFKNFASVIFTDGTFDSFNDISAGLWRTLFNPLQYVSCCIWLPFSEADYFFGNDVSSIKLGWWDLGVSCKEVVQPTIVNAITIDIPKHPQSESRGDFLNASPFSKYKLHAYPFGDFALDGSLLAPYSRVRLSFVTDTITGLSILKVSAENEGEQGTNLLTASSSLGVPIPLASTRSNFAGAIGSTGATLASGATGNLLGAEAGIISAIDCILPQQEGGGVQGSAALTASGYYLQGVFFEACDDDNAHFGRPLMSTRNISALPGFLKVQDGDVAISGTAEEYRAVKGFLEGGFYYE